MNVFFFFLGQFVLRFRVNYLTGSELRTFIIIILKIYRRKNTDIYLTFDGNCSPNK